MLKISICIPVYDPKGMQTEFIFQAIDSVLRQTYPAHEIVITANHELTQFENHYKNTRSAHFFKFLTLPSESAGANLNLSVRESSGEIIKILFQDDYLVDDNHLRSLADAYNSSAVRWTASNSRTEFSDTKSLGATNIARYTSTLRFGFNRIGAPSVISLRKKHFQPVNEDLHYLFDCEWYLRLAHNLGKPFVPLGNPIRIRIHSNQATNWARSLRLKESIKTTLLHRFRFHFMRRPLCSCIHIVR